MGVRLSASRTSCATVLSAGLLVYLAFVPLAAAGPSSVPDTSAWGTDGLVYATAVAADGTVYVGGDFTYVGPQTGSLAAVSEAGVLLGAPLEGGAASALIPDGHGGLYIGGDFTRVAGQPRKGLAHILGDGSLDPSFVVDIVGTGPGLLALSPDGSTLYMVGGFTSVAGVPRDLFAAVRTSDGTVTPWRPPTPNNGFGTIAVSHDGSVVYIGGGFTSIGGVARNGLAATDAVTGAVTSWDPHAAGNPDALVSSIVESPDGSTVYFSGGFTSVGGVPRNHLAAVDADTGSVTAWDPGVGWGGSVHALVPSTDGSTVYVGGEFTWIGGKARSGVAALDATVGLATTWAPSIAPREGFTTAVRALCLSPDGSTVYVGGAFADVGGALRANVAGIDAVTGAPTSWNPSSGGQVGSLAASGSTVFIGGGWNNSVGGVARNGLAAFDGVTGDVTEWDPGVTGYGHVHALAASADGATVYVGGYFVGVGGVPRSNVAAIDAATGVVTPWAPEANYEVVTLADGGSVVYAGGGFDFIGGKGRNCIAALDPATGAATDWKPDANRWVSSLVVSGSTVYVGGGFSSIGGQSRLRIAALSADTGRATSWNPRGDADGGITTLAVTGSTVYAAGDFQTMGGLKRRNLAAVNRSSGDVTAWSPGADGVVHALAVSADNSTVYVGGSFTTLGGALRRNLGAVSASTGVAAEWNPDPDAPVYALRIGPIALATMTRKASTASSSGTLWVGGRFGSMHDQVRPGLAVFPSGARVRLVLTRSPSGSRYTITRRSGAAYFTFTATAKKLSGQVVRGQAVRLQSSSNGTVWRTRYTLSTDSRGKASKRVRFTRAGSAYWRWYSPSNEWYNAASSSRTRVIVR